MMREPRCVMCGARPAFDGSPARSAGGPWLLLLAFLGAALVGAAAAAVAVCFLMAPAVVRHAEPVPVPGPAPRAVPAPAPAEGAHGAEARRAFDKLEVDLQVDMARGEFAHDETLRDMKRVILRLDPNLREKMEKLERTYTEAYEAAAAEAARAIVADAERLLAEKRSDEALRKLESFPKNLRRSAVWAQLQVRIDRLKADKER